MENDDWDLFSTVRSCKATTYTASATFCETATHTLPITTNTITNNIISPHNTMPYCFDDFTLTQENSTIPISPLKPNDFIELDKLIIRSNPTKIIPIPTTSDIPTPSITTTTTPTSSTTTTIITTPSTITIPNHITTDTITSTSSHGLDQSSTFFYFPTLIEQQQMQPREFAELEKWILQFNHTTTIPVSIITTPNPTSPTTSTPITFTTPTTTINTPTTTTPIIPTTTTTTITTMDNYEANGINQYPTVSNFPMLVEQQQVQANQNQVSVFDSISCIKTTTTNFHHKLNHPLVPQELQRNHNQLPILLPQTSSTALLNTNPKQQKFKSGKRKNNNQVTLVSYVKADKISEDSWRWRKYGQKSIKGSPHPRSYFKCSSFNDCLAKKLVEKLKTGEDTYEVTYLGEHNHKKPANNQNSIVGSSRNMSSNSGLDVVRETGCCSNIRNLDSPNAVMLQLDKSESNKAQVLAGESKMPYLKNELIKNAGKLDSPNMIMLQFDELESENSNVFSDESEIPDTETKFIESSDEDNILIPNMTNMLEDFFLNFNNINNGSPFR